MQVLNRVLTYLIKIYFIILTRVLQLTRYIFKLMENRKGLFIVISTYTNDKLVTYTKFTYLD